MTTPANRKRILSNPSEQKAKRSNSTSNVQFNFRTPIMNLNTSTMTSTATNTSNIDLGGSISNTDENIRYPNIADTTVEPTPSTSQQGTTPPIATKAKAQQKVSTDNLDSFRELRKLSIRQKKAEHHLQYLIQCLERKTAPKGLTTWISPNIPTHDPGFNTDWIDLHRQFSNGLTKRLVNYWQGIAEDTKKEAENLTAAIRLACDDLEFNHIIQLVNKYIEKDLKSLRTQTKNNGKPGTKQRQRRLRHHQHHPADTKQSRRTDSKHKHVRTSPT
jgi:hypothetical protein